MDETGHPKNYYVVLDECMKSCSRMSESRTGTTTRVGGGRYEKILDGLLQGGRIVNEAPPWPGGSFEDRRPQSPPREGLGTNKTRFGESEWQDIIAMRCILGVDFPSMEGPRDAVWPRL